MVWPILAFQPFFLILNIICFVNLFFFFLYDLLNTFNDKVIIHGPVYDKAYGLAHSPIHPSS